VLELFDAVEGGPWGTLYSGGLKQVWSEMGKSAVMHVVLVYTGRIPWWLSGLIA